MNTIVLFVRNAKLKMDVVRILMKNDFYFIEASTREELFIKLELIKDAGLLIMDYNKDLQDEDASSLVQTSSRQLPILLIIPDEFSYILPSYIKKLITDIILTPFKTNTLIRKIKAMVHIQENKAKLRQKAEPVTKITSSRNDKIMKALDCAAREGYSICIFRFFVSGAFMELNLQLLEKLQQTLRYIDEIIETDLGEFIILCPHIPFENLHIVETKIKDAILPIVQAALPNRDIKVYSTIYPEEVKTYNEIMSMLSDEHS